MSPSPILITFCCAEASELTKNEVCVEKEEHVKEADQCFFIMSKITDMMYTFVPCK